MRKRPVTCIVIADGSRARILRHRAGAGLTILREIDEPEARKPSRDLVSSGPGRDRESANPAHHAIEPKHDPHQETERAFLRRIAGEAHAEAAVGAVDRVIIAAPPRAMGVLRQELSAAIRGKLAAEITKDLTKTPLAELPPHFADFLRG